MEETLVKLIRSTLQSAILRNAFLGMSPSLDLDNPDIFISVRLTKAKLDSLEAVEDSSDALLAFMSDSHLDSEAEHFLPALERLFERVSEYSTARGEDDESKP